MCGYIHRQNKHELWGLLWYRSERLIYAKAIPKARVWQNKHELWGLLWHRSDELWGLLWNRSERLIYVKAIPKARICFAYGYIHVCMCPLSAISDTSKAIAIKVDTVTALVTGIHHMLLCFVYIDFDMHARSRRS